MPKSGELTYFESIGEEGRQHAINKPFSDAETPRFFADMAVVFSLLPHPPARVLECGCGTGWLTRFLGRKGYAVLGQDCSSDAIELAKAHPVFEKEGDVDFVCSDYDELAYQSEFDAVLFYASLHHTTDLHRSIEMAYKSLRPGGVFLAIEPGLGHERRSEATREQYDVGDRDMPPFAVIRYGKRIGFRKRRIYQHAGQLMSTLYGESPSSVWLKRLWRVPGMKVAALLFSWLFYKRYNGTVWMQK